MSEQKPPLPFVFWIIWFAILNGLFIILFFAAGGIPEGSTRAKYRFRFCWLSWRSQPARWGYVSY